MNRESLLGPLKRVGRRTRSAVVVAGLSAPAVFASAGCWDGSEVPANITTTSQEIRGDFPKDTDQYRFQLTVQAQSWFGENAVELYTDTPPSISKSGTAMEVVAGGLVFCPADNDGDSVNCSSRRDIFFNGVNFNLTRGGIIVAEKYDKDESKSLSNNRKDYKYEVTVQVEVGDNEDAVSIYTNEQPVLDNSGSLPVITIPNAFCPEDQQGAQLGCNPGSDRFFRSMTLIGGFGSTGIKAQQ